MSSQNKVYVIDPLTSRESGKATPPVDKKEEGPTGNSAPRKKTAGKDAKVSAAKTNDRESGVLLLLSYLAGPLSIFATRRNRKSGLSVGLGVLSVVLGAVVLVLWQDPRIWSSHEGPAGAMVLVAAGVAVITGCFSWTRAVILAGRHEGPRLRRSPGWLRRPLAAGLFGAISPGMGLFAAGRSKQAACTIWMTGITLLSLVVVSRAGWLWEFNSHAGAFALRPETLEYILACTSALAIIGMLAWTTQLLNGMRLAAPAKDRKAGPEKNWAAVALLVSVFAFSAFFRPAVIAEAFDRSASLAENRGMRLIPLRLSLIAASLDPSRPEYTVRAIGLYEETGDQVSAELLRGELVSRFAVSLPFLEEEGIIASRNAREDGSGNYRASLEASTPGGAAMSGPAIPTIPAGLMTLDWGISRAEP